MLYKTILPILRSPRVVISGRNKIYQQRIRHSRSETSSRDSTCRQAEGTSMSSTPITPGSPDVKSPSSSPPSSPPSAHVSDEEYDPRVEKMQAEEERLKEETKQERKQTKEDEKQRLESEDSQSMTDLDWFLSRSQVGISSVICKVTNVTGLLIRHHGPAQASFGSQEDSNRLSTQTRVWRQNARLPAGRPHMAHMSVLDRSQWHFSG